MTVLEALAAILPDRAKPYAKFIYGALFVAGSVVSASIPESPLWLTVALAVLSSLATVAIPAPGYVPPDGDAGPPGRHVKP